MNPHFNKLTPAEAERIALLMEECGEVIQICGKILRHGLNSHHPDDPVEKPNRLILADELGHVMFAAGLMVAGHDIPQGRINDSCELKAERVWPYLHHQPKEILG